MTNIQRLFIGSLIAVVYVTYYSIPFSLTSKIGIIGASITPVVYSATSAFHISNREKFEKLVGHSLKGMALLYGLLSLVLVVFSKEVILLWMGEDFYRSIIVLQILSVGMFFDGMSWIFGTFLQGIGKPKAITLVAVIQVPIDILLTWLLIKNFGITGAATAWALLRGIGAGLLYLSCKRFHVLDFRFRINTNYIKGLCLILLILLVNVLLKTLHGASLLFLVVNALILIVGYMFVALNYLLDSTQKRIVIENVKLCISVLLMRKVQGQTVQNT
jgi:O-antigen/teichoic acid export membrane protein